MFILLTNNLKQSISDNEKLDEDKFDIVIKLSPQTLLPAVEKKCTVLSCFIPEIPKSLQKEYFHLDKVQFLFLFTIRIKLYMLIVSGVFGIS